MTLVYLAVGSNLGNREQYLRSARRGLDTCGVNIVRGASIYSTEPQEVLDQPWFLNTVLEANTALTPDELLTVCLELEKHNGRQREIIKGPRTLDIDIIFYGTAILSKPGLSIPHPRFSERRFVMVPLAQIAPDFIDPMSGKTVRKLLEACPDTSTVIRYADEHFWLTSG